jgi:uncharacterized protein
MSSAFRLERFAFFLLLISTFSFGQKQVPELWGQRVHDEAHVLKTETIDLLESKLKTFEDSTSNQIAILIVQSLDGDVIEDYSLRVAEKWQLGKKDKDNGILLLIAIDDHKMRIEVGHGLEGSLTDVQSNRIIRNEMAPNFRRGDYDTGVIAAIDSIILAIKGEYKADAASDNTVAWVIFGIVFSIICIVALIMAFVNEFKGCTTSKDNALKDFNRYQEKKKKRKSTSSGSGAGMFSGINIGSSSSSGSSSGSSFLGGGGSFGGGGSSGSW